MLRRLTFRAQGLFSIVLLLANIVRFSEVRARTTLCTHVVLNQQIVWPFEPETALQDPNLQCSKCYTNEFRLPTSTKLDKLDFLDLARHWHL